MADDCEWRLLLILPPSDISAKLRSSLTQCKKHRISLTEANSIEAGRQRLITDHFDSVIVSEDLGFDSVLALIQEFTDQAYPISFILFFTQDQHNREIESILSGATIYIRGSELDLTRLEQIITYSIEHKQIEISLRQSEMELQASNERLTSELAERQRVEAALHIERQRMDDVFDELPVYLILLTPDYHVALQNRFFRERFGESRGRRCYEFLFGRSQPCEICMTYEVLKTNQPLEWEWIGPDHHNYYIYDFPFTDRDGSNLIMEVGLDVTERKRAEAELDKHRQHLEELVKERTSQLELINTQLKDEIEERQQAEEALQEYTNRLELSNQALSDFAFIVSHDLREPLRKVQAYGDLLKNRYAQQLGAEGQDFIKRMEQANQRMVAMLDSLQAYSHVTTEKQPFTSVDLSKAAEEALSDLEVRLHQTGGKVLIDPLPMIRADGSQIRQLFQNLIGNALKFHRPDVPPIVQVTGKSISKDCVELLISDNGIGFEQKQAEKLFRPFHRLNDRSEYEGTGMGLAICRKIVERHNGSISVTSAPGQGTTFRVILPIRQADK